MKNANIGISIASQASLKTLATDSFESKLVWECRMDVIQLAIKKNRVSMIWVSDGRWTPKEKNRPAIHWYRILLTPTQEENSRLRSKKNGYPLEESTRKNTTEEIYQLLAN